MKKILLSLFVITTFTAYAFSERAKGAEYSVLSSQARDVPIKTKQSGANSRVATIAATTNPPIISNPPRRRSISDDEGNYEDSGEDGEYNEDGYRGVSSQTTTPTPSSSNTTKTQARSSTMTSPMATTPASMPMMNHGMYKNGSYTGSVADAYYGNIQVEVIIQSGKIADVVFLDYPQDRGTSIRINTQAMPLLKNEAIQAQNAQVDIVSGATATSEAFRESLVSALTQAKV